MSAILETPGQLRKRLQGTKAENAIFAALRSSQAEGEPAAHIALKASRLGRDAGVEIIAAIPPWLDAWRAEVDRCGAALETASKNFVLAKRITIPKAISFSDLSGLLTFLGAEAHSKTLKLQAFLKKMTDFGFDAEMPDITLRKIYRASSEDQQVLLDLILWRREQSDEVLANIALREIPVDTLHTKWVETHGDLVLSVFRVLGWLRGESGDLHDRLGLAPEDRGEVWYRLNQAQCGVNGQKLRNGHAPSEFTAAPIGIDRVMIVENKTTFQRLPVAAGMCLIFGSGKAILKYAREMTWLGDMPRILYWGDCDGAGYEILSGLRETLPQVRSILMDEKHVLKHLHLATKEAASESVASPLPQLQDRETRARKLLHDRAQRLEQEKVSIRAVPVAIEDFWSQQSKTD